MSPSPFDGDVLTFNVTEFAESSPEALVARLRARAGCQITYPWHFWLLLRPGRRAERKEQSTERKGSDCFLHVFPLFNCCPASIGQEALGYALIPMPPEAVKYFSF